MKKPANHFLFLFLIPALLASKVSARQLVSDSGIERNSNIFGDFVGTIAVPPPINKENSVYPVRFERLPASRLSGSYPSVAQINESLFGNSASNPFVGSNANVPFSLRADGKEFLRGFDAGGKMRVWGKYTNDRNSQEWFNRGQLVIGSEGSNNAIIGFVSNNLLPATLSFPTAITGISYNKGTGNAAFSMYGETHATVPGLAIGAEFAAFQDGNPAPRDLPFDNSIGTPQTIAKSLQLTAGSSTKMAFNGDLTNGSSTISNLSSAAGLFVGQLVEGTGIPWASTILTINAATSSVTISANATLSRKQAALHAVSPAGVATEVGREGSTSGIFQTANFVQRDAALQWSYYQDNSNQTGPRNGMYLGYNGVGIGAIFQPSVNVNGNNAVISINNASGVSQASVRQNGQAYFGSSTTVGSALTLQNAEGTCTLTPTATSTAFACASDELLKKNITDARFVLDWISSFRIREYNLKSTGQHLFGVIAQEVQKIHPKMVHVADDGTLLLDAPNQWVLVKGIQELRSENDSLKLELRIVEMIGAVGFLGLAWRNFSRKKI